MINRLLVRKLKNSKKSIILLGPRQVGKSTLLKSLEPQVKINLSLETEYLRHLSDSSLLVSIIKGKKVKTVFIDEIQRIPSLLNTIQAILDDWKNPPLFYLSGSSARKLKRGNANLLPGRIFLYHLFGLAASELGYEIQLEKALRFGFLPEPYLSEDEELAEKILLNYSATYLVEEIQAEALTRNIQGFSRFLNVLGGVSGMVLDFSKLSQKSNVSRSTVIRFIEILEDTLIAERIENFSETEADIIRHPKLFFFDIGVLNGLLRNFEPSQDRLGNLWEHLVFSQIRNSIYAKDLNGKIYFFRTRNGLEVDFIVKIKNDIFAIEAKYGQVHAGDINSLLAFKKYFPRVKKCFVVSSKENVLRIIDNIIICGLSEMLQEMGL